MTIRKSHGRAVSRVSAAGLALCALAVAPAGSGAVPPAKVVYNRAFESLPYRFEENRGQAPAGNKFVARSARYELLTAAEGPVMLFDGGNKKARAALGTVIRGGNRQAVISGEQALETRANYLIGNQPDKWVENVASYGRVRYSEVYPSIDLIFYGNDNNAEFDFEVKPGGDPRRIALSWNGIDKARGSGKVRIDANGDLLIATPAGDVRWAKPVIYQKRGGNRTEVAGNFRLKNNVVSFEIADYDRSATLVIDPVVSFATYIGGTGNESSRAIAVDGSGNILIAGVTTTTSLPTSSGVAQSGYGGATSDTITGDAFVAQLNSAGTALNWITYLGGQSDDAAFGIAVDSSGNSYVTGMTNSMNFPVLNAQNANFIGAGGNKINPLGDAFLSKLSPAGKLVYSTYFGGTQDDAGLGVAVDSSGNAYITGVTLSTNLPIGASTYQKGFKGSGGNPDVSAAQGPVFRTGDAFATKFDANGKLVWTTYIGGSLDDFGMAIAVDKTGVYVAGGTLSSDFPVSSGAFQTKFGGTSSNQNQPYIHMGDGFVVKIDPTGSSLLYGTYIGGTSDDAIFGMALDSTGAVYVTGATVSSDFPVSPSALQTTFKGPSAASTYKDFFLYGDGFAAKLNPAGSALVYSTYFGGSGDDAGQAIAVDAGGNAYIVGQTTSKDFPTTAGAVQTAYFGDGGESQAIGDTILIELDPKGSVELYATYLGGNRDDSAAGIVVDASGNAWVTGYTVSTNFPVTKGAYQTVFGGSNRNGAPYGDAFVVKYSGLPTGLGVTINSGGVVPVYSSSTTIEPGNWFSIYGNNLASATTLWKGDFPTSLGGTTVTVNGKSAFLWFVSAGQINAQAPDDTTTGSVPVVVSNSAGTVTASVNLAQASPSFLLLGDGKHATGIIITPNGGGSQAGGGYDLLGPSSTGAGFRPAKKGEPVALYGVGFGLTNPQVPAGGLYSCPAMGCATLATLPQISVGGVQVQVAFGGIVSAGLYQFNFSIPSNVASGDQALVATVNGVQTQTGIVIPIQ